MITGCYVLHLYCRHSSASTGAPVTDTEFRRHGQGPAEFTGPTLRATRREARRLGWRFRGGDVTCPACVRDAAGGVRPVRRAPPVCSR